MNINGQWYSLLRGSDIKRDGMFLELYARADPYDGSLLAECFCSDVDGSMQLTEYAAGVSISALAWLQSEAARLLPPTRDTT